MMNQLSLFYEGEPWHLLRRKGDNIRESLGVELRQPGVQVELARVQSGSVHASNCRGCKARVERPRCVVTSKHFLLVSDDSALDLDRTTRKT